MRTIIPKTAKLLPENAQRVFKGEIFDTYQWRQEMFDGSFETFEMLKRDDSVKIIAIKDNKIVIIEEEQPSSSLFIDIPSGRHDHEEETELQAAKRELLEETGMEFKTWKLLKIEQPHSKIDWFVYIFLAYDFKSQSEQTLDAGEKIQVHFRSLDEVAGLLKDPKNRYMPKDIFEQVRTTQELKDLPAYNGIKI